MRLNPKWHAFYASLNNIHSSRYIPENIYDADYNLLNIKNYAKSLPVKEVDGFIKPTIDSGYGKNIKKCKIRDGKIFIDEVLQDINKLKSSYNGEFIIQKGIDQSSILSDIYPCSVNSIRSVSLRDGNKIVVLSTQLHFGNHQSYVSYTGYSAVVCGVDQYGKMTEFGYDGKFNKIFEHPFTRKPFKDIALPKFSELEKVIIQGHERLPHFKLVYWDFGLDNLNQYVMIEYNLLFPGINYHQVIDGPIFEKYLDGIMDNLHEPEYI